MRPVGAGTPGLPYLTWVWECVLWVEVDPPHPPLPRAQAPGLVRGGCTTLGIGSSPRGGVMAVLVLLVVVVVPAPPLPPLQHHHHHQQQQTLVTGTQCSPPLIGLVLACLGTPPFCSHPAPYPPWLTPPSHPPCEQGPCTKSPAVGHGCPFHGERVSWIQPLPLPSTGTLS